MATEKQIQSAAIAATPQWDDYSYGRAVSALTTMGDPDRVLRELGKPRSSLRALEHDDEVSAALETRREAVMSTPWSLTGKDGKPDSRVDDLRHIIERKIDPILRGAWTAIPYGFSMLRVAWDHDPITDLLAPVWVGEWNMDRFSVSADGQAWFRPEDGSGKRPAVQPEFFLTTRNATWENPYGEALLSRVYWPWFFRYNNWRFWMQFIERFGDPILVGKVIDPAAFVEYAKQMGFASVIGVNAGIENESGQVVNEDLTTVSPTGSGEHQRLSAVIDARIQKVILGQTLTSQVDGKGSYAAAKVHDGVRNDKRLADIRLITVTVQRIVDVIWMLNDLTDTPPRFSFDLGVGLSKDKADTIKTLRDAGWQATDQLLGKVFGDLEPGDLIAVEPTQAKPAPTDRPMSASPPARLAADDPPRFTPAQQELEELIADATVQAASPIPAADIREAIRRAKDPQDLDRRLAQLAGDMDPIAYRSLLERSLFAADVNGYVAAQERKI
jgi:phage gp29-like protein